HEFLGLEAADRPTAVICANDDTAIGFIKTVLDAGLSVPGDVSVIGFDGAAVDPFMTPSLSTVQQDTAELGRRAANLITDIVLGEHKSNQHRFEVPCTIVLRDSVRAL
ncbi:MAG: transcriptional regulator, LacI family, partial [Devosia sp.]|nr:transcriptional regulator, LacI family [Devosia sp.]